MSSRNREQRQSQRLLSVFSENYLEEKYGKEEALKRTYVTTDKAKGALKTVADEEGMETFVIPDDVGGVTPF